MHGIIFLLLKKYAERKVGDSGWRELLAASGVGADAVFLPIKDYPDQNALAIVAAASKHTGLDEGTILEDFGSFIVPDLLDVYRSLVQPKWRTLDLIENTE